MAECPEKTGSSCHDEVDLPKKLFYFYAVNGIITSERRSAPLRLPEPLRRLCPAEVFQKCDAARKTEHRLEEIPARQLGRVERGAP